MEPIRVQTQLHSRYSVLDISGRLPFDIVFGLRRKFDSDARDVSSETSHSFLDIPYALANGFLSIHELQHSQTGPDEHIEVDLTRLRSRQEGKWALPSIAVESSVEPGSPLTHVLESGKNYSLRLAKRDLGAHRWIEHDRETPSEIQGPPASTDFTAAETCKLVGNPHGGYAVFTVVDDLIWPPTVKIGMHLTRPQPSSDKPSLQVTAANTGSETISIQTRGQQHFLSPWGPFQPEADDGLNAGKRPCILDPSAAIGHLQVIEATTGSVAGEVPKPAACSGLTSGRPDTRPKVDGLLVLQPGSSFSREVNIKTLLRDLEDGRYRIRLLPKGCWWCFGEVEAEPGDDGKVPKRLRHGRQTPLVIESEDEVEFEFRDGKIVDSE